MRKANDPNYKVDWTQTDAVNRSSVQTAYMKGEDLVSCRVLGTWIDIQGVGLLENVQKRDLFFNSRCSDWDGDML